MKTIFSTLIFCFLLSASAFAQEAAQKFDEFTVLPCDEYMGRMDTYLVHARDNPSLQIYVLIYEGKEPVYNARERKAEMKPPVFGSAEAKIRSIKKYMSYRKLPINRFSFVKAGFRENAAVEIWTVPNGATPPKPTPTLMKMKYRKGKPKGFCTDCC
ncbi:MAG: hypothetical protein M3384_13445 [Acidobacteriota bacterium]|nr:hypothetical protein [Acidobacteriota bacterium]